MIKPQFYVKTKGEKMIVQTNKNGAIEIDDNLSVEEQYKELVDLALSQLPEYKTLNPVDLALALSDLQQTIKLALSETVQSLYFNDNRDYKSALWHIVMILGGEEAVEMLKKDDEKAYEKYCG